MAEKPERGFYILGHSRLYVQLLSHVRLFVTPWTVACQAPLSMGFFQARILEWLLFPPPGDLPDSGIEPASLESPALADRLYRFDSRLALLNRKQRQRFKSPVLFLVVAF